MAILLVHHSKSGESVLAGNLDGLVLKGFHNIDSKTI